MKRIAPFIVALLVGCHSPRVPTEQVVFEQNMDYFRPALGQEVSTEVLARIPLRIQRLKPGMAPSEILRELGLAGYPACYSSGPAANYGFHLELSTNCYMTLLFDMLKKPPAFLRAGISGDGWQDFKR